MNNQTINDAIIEVFKREEKPLRVKDIFLRIIEDKLYEFNTSTPEHVVRTALRRHSDSLNFPSSSSKKLYTTLPDGTYWLKGKKLPNEKNNNKESKEDIGLKSNFNELKELHNKYTHIFKQSILNQLKLLTPDAFESFCKQLLIAFGFKNVVVTPSKRDKGIDGYGELKIGLAYMKVAFQCKRWNDRTIGRPRLNQFRGDIQGSFQQGIYFTTSKFTKEAKASSFQQGAVPIILIDGLGIVDIMIEKRLGIEVEELPIYTNAIDLVINGSE
ncbi:restriction endonuclease [Rhodocytophaga rosea]|uniref:Restriction endonuclease n=1 Tax=Rhodocytophaga rosea TaxID=2704465 RepID=A0A6C0GL70_9BACT|nr:restriction endonuclease [Rhodocytophaga rosea]QHT68697.1 restriction endonuclease [Rhodocytophaga rosea]